jgi:hypothetical protein
VQNIIEEGGEGLILQRQGSLYERGRSPSLLKVKVFVESNLAKPRPNVSKCIQTAQADQEGIVEGIGDKNSVILKLYVNFFRLHK